MSNISCSDMEFVAPSKGQIQIIFGPMFSGKTTELIRRLRRYQIAKYKCLIVKYANDDRYSESDIVSHDHQSLAAVSARQIAEFKPKTVEYDVVGIDEGQFFPDVVECCEELANRGKIVIVAALDGTFQRVGFGNILNLIPLAESVVKLSAVCMVCFGNASFTKRTCNETKLEVIGGADKYMAVCRMCHLTSVAPRSPLKQIDNEITKSMEVCSKCRKLTGENIFFNFSWNCDQTSDIVCYELHFIVCCVLCVSFHCLLEVLVFSKKYYSTRQETSNIWAVSVKPYFSSYLSLPLILC